MLGSSGRMLTRRRCTLQDTGLFKGVERTSPGYVARERERASACQSKRQDCASQDVLLDPHAAQEWDGHMSAIHADVKTLRKQLHPSTNI